ncbi:unnamed protein product [Litomosoides sigmodontis]|uniref:PRELI/MSF1 domain-containing protein n=1 Tax=Litomosoides sigmodontis TaxID=42156 RepID=A0A3P6SGU0_LITSI|nr:unnamed protein product [Litomosoides sigmodontis]
MKFWASEHIFDHPWDTVAHAAWCKYPNPMNCAVSGIDVLRQHPLVDGSLRSERIIQSHFPIPSWVTKITGFSGTQYSYEVTEINPAKKEMTLVTRNMNAGRFLRVDERLSYKPDPYNEDRTVLQQEASVNVDLPAFADHCEKMFLNIYEKNAEKGRKGLEWVIDQFNSSSRSNSSAEKSSSQGFSDPTLVISSLHSPPRQPSFMS